jgi:hypothetical protein
MCSAEITVELEEEGDEDYDVEEEWDDDDDDDEAEGDEGNGSGKGKAQKPGSGAKGSEAGVEESDGDRIRCLHVEWSRGDFDATGVERYYSPKVGRWP